jgi:hypothetical protein
VDPPDVQRWGRPRAHRPRTGEGQLIDFSRETRPEQVAARRLAEDLSRFADALTEMGIEPSERGDLSWFWEQRMARSAFPTASQHAEVQERRRSMKSSKHYFERTTGKSNRFWEITHDAARVTTRFGEIGTEGRSTSTP